MMLWTMAGSVMLAGLAGCRAEQTQEAKAPEVDLDVDAGQWPRYKVKWADVDVGTTERTVTVPIVRVEKQTRQISVPYIDINPPGTGDREERAVTIELDVPHTGYELQITDVLAAGDGLWVVAHLTGAASAGGMGATRVSDQVVVNAPDDLDVRKVVIGQRPDGVFNQQFRFVASRAALNEQVPAGARVLYHRESKPQVS
ncbi:hypothetical protein [Luteitalea sp.]